jgi:hypothetical protein
LVTIEDGPSVVIALCRRSFVAARPVGLAGHHDGYQVTSTSVLCVSIQEHREVSPSGSRAMMLCDRDSQSMKSGPAYTYKHGVAVRVNENQFRSVALVTMPPVVILDSHTDADAA